MALRATDIVGDPVSKDQSKIKIIVGMNKALVIEIDPC